jgi:RTX calcium-binding nonapeptide repeat (4 copies)
MEVEMTRHAGFGMLFRRVAALAAAGAALAAPVAGGSTYPDSGGSRFNSDTDGWRDTEADCRAGLGSLCSMSNRHSAGEGNPPGSLEVRMRVTANALGTFRGESVLRSPSFRALGGGRATLSYDRRLEAEGMLALSPSSTIAPTLVDESSEQPHPLGGEELSSSEAVFSARRLEVPTGLVAGRSYHLELRTVMTTSVAREGLLGDLMLRVDNVALHVEDGRDSLPAGAAGSAGVRFSGTTLGARAFASLAASIPYRAETGPGQGGTVVPIERCTIVGTPGSDRIKGSPGNDVICGLGGNDRINGGRGRDIVDGGNGNDRLAGSSGGDLIAGLRGRDRLDGGAGADRLGGGAGKDRLRGRGGRDRLHGGSAFDRLSAGGGADRLATRDGRRDLVDGGSGRDRSSGDSSKRVGRGRADTHRRIERLRR